MVTFKNSKFLKKILSFKRVLLLYQETRFLIQFCSSVARSCLTPWARGLQHARLHCPSLSRGVCSDLCPLSQCCHLISSSSVAPLSSVALFSSCPQSFPVLGCFPMSLLFAWSGQNMGVSALASVLPKNTQDWFPLGWTSLISLQSKGLSRVFSNTTVQKHEFFSKQLSLWSNSHIHTWLLEKP